MFSGVRSAASTSIDDICEFVGYRVVYHDLRDPALNCLYSGGVNPPPLPKGAVEKGGGGADGASAGHMRLGGVLEKCHPFLVVIADVINSDMRDKVVMSLLSALVHAYQRSLLAGGPSRIYTVSGGRGRGGGKGRVTGERDLVNREPHRCENVPLLLPVLRCELGLLEAEPILLHSCNKCQWN